MDENTVKEQVDPPDSDQAWDERWTRAVIDSIGDGIAVADRNGNLLLFNPAAERILGLGVTSSKPDQWSDTYGIYLSDGKTSCPPEDLPLARAIRGENVAEQEMLVRNESREADIPVRVRATPVVDSTGELIGGVAVFHDISEQKRTVEAMKRAERLISIGTLAAGVAHEVNNPVGAMVLTAEDALESLKKGGPSDSVQESLQLILRQAQRCSEIVRRILKFADQQTSPKSIHDLRGIVDNSVALVRHKAEKSEVECRIDQPDEPCEVCANATELTQVIVNLLSNAIEASVGASMVNVSITRSDDFVIITVTDQGCGIAAQQQERIFDAFYTTRLRDDSTGLGLSIANAIVDDHGGTIQVSSRPNEGTRFTVRLPSCQSVAAKATRGNALLSEDQSAKASSGSKGNAT